jgi:hypothetical protein
VERLSAAGHESIACMPVGSVAPCFRAAMSRLDPQLKRMGKTQHFKLSGDESEVKHEPAI